jgi:hypothetical protein
MEAGAQGRTRTDTQLPEPDFESGASTNFATRAGRCDGTQRLKVNPPAKLRQPPAGAGWRQGAAAR